MPRIEIYTKAYCPYCSRAKALLGMKGVSFEEYDIGRDSPKRMEMLERAPGHFTVPQIFINDRHVGGCDDMFALDRAGELDPLLTA